ncbi:MAG: NifU family protein [Vicinamibacterales bacterium]
MTRRDAVEYLLERIRPALQADGGDVELVGLEGDLARVRLTGACAHCPTAQITVQAGIETALRQAGPRLRVVAVQ